MFKKVMNIFVLISSLTIIIVSTIGLYFNCYEALILLIPSVFVGFVSLFIGIKPIFKKIHLQRK